MNDYSEFIVLLVIYIVIIAKNQQKKIWGAHWFNGTSIYKTPLENVVEFRKENCFPVAIKFGYEITT